MNTMRYQSAFKSSPVRFGALVWVLGTVQFFVCQFIVQTAWTSPPYSWSRNNVSDLGNIYCQPWGDNARYVCSPLHALMNTSAVIEGICIIGGIIMLRSLWGQLTTARAVRSLLVIASLALILAALVPADVNENVHVLGGGLFLTVCGNLGLMLTGFVSRTYHMRGIRILAGAMGSLGLVATGCFFSGHYLGLGMGGMERFAVFTVPVWTLIAGCSFLISSARGSHRMEGNIAVETRQE